MKKELSLEEAREALDETFISPEGSVKLNDSGDKFLVQQFEQFDPPLTFEHGKNFTVDSYGQYVHDFQYRSFPEYTDGMNMEFHGAPSVLFGKYRTDGDGDERIFEPTDPKEAEQVLIRVGSLNKDYDGHSSSLVGGQSANSPEALSSRYFSEFKCSRYHNSDIDMHEDKLNFYIVDVGHVLGQPDRDVSQYLEEMSARIAQEEIMFDQQRAEREAQIQADHEEYLRQCKLAEEAGCPTHYQYPNDDMSFPFVFDENGKSVEPDDYDQKNETSEWDRIFATDVVIALTRDSENAPFVFHPEWIPQEMSKAQENAIQNTAYNLARTRDTKLIDENGQYINPEDTIRICEEKRIEQETDRAFDEFKSIEEQLEDLTAESLEIEVDKQDTAYHLGERYLELADQYGFETKFEIKMEKNPEIGNENRAAGNRNSDLPGDR